MLSMLIAYDANGNVVATLDYVVSVDEEGNAIGLIDFSTHEDSGRSLTEIWRVDNAVGSGTWPEWLGAQAHNFKVEVDQGTSVKRIRALVHKRSGNRRDRATIERAISERMKQANGKAADLRDLVGGPDRPVRLDGDGKTIRKPRTTTSTIPKLHLRKLSRT